MKFSFSEREYEDWLCERADRDCEESWQTRILNILDEYIYDRGQRFYIMRQVSIGNGFADIVLRGPKQVFVIELKAVKADGEALAQVMAYADRLEILLRNVSPEIKVDKFILAPEFSEKLLKASVYIDDLHLIKCVPSFTHEDMLPYDSCEITKHERYLKHCFDDFSDDAEKEEVKNSA